MIGNLLYQCLYCTILCYLPALCHRSRDTKTDSFFFKIYISHIFQDKIQTFSTDHSPFFSNNFCYLSGRLLYFRFSPYSSHAINHTDTQRNNFKYQPKTISYCFLQIIHIWSSPLHMFHLSASRIPLFQLSGNQIYT